MIIVRLWCSQRGKTFSSNTNDRVRPSQERIRIFALKHPKNDRDDALTWVELLSMVAGLGGCSGHAVIRRQTQGFSRIVEIEKERKRRAKLLAIAPGADCSDSGC